MIRNPRERVQKLAPFLSFDGDPYPVALDGRVVWVIDGYTTSNRYPYGQGADLSQLDAGAGLKHSLNYVRNSVKAVVDAYDGSVTLYVNDDIDPVLQVWRSAFPDLFEPFSTLPAGLADHLRYPEELFRLQTAAYSKYQLDDAAKFFDRDGAWSIALAAPEQPPQRVTIDNATTTTTADSNTAEADAGASSFPVEQKADRFVPYYTMFHPDGSSRRHVQPVPAVPAVQREERPTRGHRLHDGRQRRSADRLHRQRGAAQGSQRRGRQHLQRRQLLAEGHTARFRRIRGRVRRPADGAGR